MIYTFSAVGGVTKDFHNCKKKTVAWTYSSASDIDIISVLRIFKNVRMLIWLFPWWGWSYVRVENEKKKNLIERVRFSKGMLSDPKERLLYNNLTIWMWRKFVAIMRMCKKNSPFWNTQARQIKIYMVHLHALDVLSHNLTIIWRDSPNLTVKNFFFYFFKSLNLIYWKAQEIACK